MVYEILPFLLFTCMKIIINLKFFWNVHADIVTLVELCFSMVALIALMKCWEHLPYVIPEALHDA